ncbi:hypothetical protein [Sinomicrobium weinanense]|uniref:Uncharacterized protein n=1 Tax=Sinomicrobium weinanense TaxID=2842200 RepID=A0A926JVD1_9FLAO|nr:hypothetical protein [Sinomicrobium weinanense]MBC9798268.1 hypothetical protein [Sinomicrobium weinanense]MBU3125334.1 hypothetical protein [Sinomicrobium weinanense]
MKLKIIAALLIGLSSRVAFSQDLHLFLNNIEEARTTVDNVEDFVELTTMVNGIELDTDHQVRIKEITEAKDDRGNSLQQLERSFFDSKFGSSKNLTIRLEAPVRQATRIETVEGLIEYFTPTEENGGSIVREDFLRHQNKNLLSDAHPELALTLIEKDAFLDLKEKDEQAYKAWLKKLKKENDISGSEEELLDLFSDFFNSTTGWEGEYRKSGIHLLYFYIREQGGKYIHAINVYNEEGNMINHGYSRNDIRYELRLSEKVTPGCRMEIIVEHAGAIEELKFSLKNIYLP